MLPSMRAAARLSRSVYGLGPLASRSIVQGRICGSWTGITQNCHSLHSVRFSSTEAQQPQSQQTQSQSQQSQQSKSPNTTKKIPSLKSVLRKFYLATHPDKFSDHPEAKAVNEHSLRDFLTYIEEYKRNPRGTALGKPRRIPLTFYIKNETNGELKKVSSELISNSTNSSAAKRRLMNLFSACGLESDFTFEKDVWIPSDTASLQEFLSSSLMHAREYHQKATTHNTYVNGVISDIERKHGFRIGMSIGAESYYAPSENREVVDKLHSLISDLESEGWLAKGFMKGVEIGMESESETSARDTAGNVYLSRKEGKDDWEIFLKKMDWQEVHSDRAKAARNDNEEARKRHASQEARKKKQEDLAKLIGVRAVDVSPFNQFECQHSGESHVKSNSKDLDDAEVEDYEKEAHNALDTLLAAKRVSTKITPKELLDLLTTKLTTLQELAQKEDKSEVVRDYVSTRLGLKVLSVDYTYFHSDPESVLQSRRAYDKLHKLSDKLRNFPLGGLTVGISDHYGLNLDGSLFIKWDFSDEDAIMLLESVKQQKEIDPKAEHEDAN